MTTPGLFLIRDNIFGHLSYEDLEICCEVSDSWNESLNKNSSLKKQSLVKNLLEFGRRQVKIYLRSVYVRTYKYEWKEVHEVIPGWNKAVKKVGNKASLDDLKEIKESLQKYDPAKSSPENPVFWAASKGYLKLMKLFFETSFDMNTRDGINGNVFLEACAYSEHSESSEMVQLIIQSSKDHGIDLNMQDVEGHSAFHSACQVAPLKIPKLLLENYEEFGIDIMHEDRRGYTALDMIKARIDMELDIEEGVEEWEEFKSVLEEEYAKHDSLEPAA